MSGLRRIVSQLDNHKRLWFFLCVMSFFSVWDMTYEPALKMSLMVQIIYSATVCALKATLLLLLYCLCEKIRVLKVLCILFIAVYSFLSIVNIVSFIVYGFGITGKMILILAQTTPGETAGFLPGMFSNIATLLSFKEPYVYISLACAAIVYFAKWLNKYAFCVLWTTMCVCGAVAFTIYCNNVGAGRTGHSLFIRTVKYTKEVKEWNDKFKKFLARRRPISDVSTITSNHLASNIIVVLGESASRAHHSLYGYPLPTTPCMDAMKNELYVFSDVIGSSSSTAGNMERILSFKRDDAVRGDGLDYPFVVDFFNEAGYKTFWLSNQERAGAISNSSGVMAANADVIKYVGADTFGDVHACKYDEALLPVFYEAVDDSCDYKMVFVHLMGSHTGYKSRYPDEFEKIIAADEIKAFPSLDLSESKARVRAEYDNSIGYTDYILSSIFKKLEEFDGPTVLIYFSDHGEMVYDDGKFIGRCRQSVEVPFFIYLNSRYKNQNPEITQRVSAAVDRPYSTANLAHLLLTLSGSTYSHYKPELDLISNKYDAGERYVDEKVWVKEKD